MACNSPLDMFRTMDGELRTRRGLGSRVVQEHVKVPCGKCMGCRVSKKREWTIRCKHEMSLHEATAFVTLTYSDEHLPFAASLSPKDLELFLKRYRITLKRKYNMNCRFIACGEYGDKTLRPHYHLMLFGGWPPDAKFHHKRKKVDIYTSELLLNAWGKGNVDLSMATTDKVGGYISSYITKKAYGLHGQIVYQRVDHMTGEIHDVEPEFQRQSTNPGLGAGWYEKYGDRTHELDSVIHRGKEQPVPRYYDKLLEKKDPDRLAALKEQRQIRAEALAKKNPDEQNPYRLQTKELCAVLYYHQSRDKRKL